jgi:hypothetical protein
VRYALANAPRVLIIESRSFVDVIDPLSLTQEAYAKLTPEELRNINNLEYGSIGGWCQGTEGASVGASISRKRGNPVKSA